MPLLVVMLMLMPFVTPFSTTRRSPTVTISCHPPPRRGPRRPPAHPSHATTTTTGMGAHYGRGSEIWPPVNDEPISLSSSFPGGVIPAPARDILDNVNVRHSSMQSPPAMSDDTPPDIEPSVVASSSVISPPPSTTLIRGMRRRAVRRTLSHVLSSAARASTRRARSYSSSSDDGPIIGVPPPAISRGPVILALSLLCGKCVDARHVLAVIGMTAYILGLASWCAAPKVGRGRQTRHHQIVNMPSLPIRGHVPDLIKNPLGSSLTASRTYRTWLRAGAILGVLLPVLALARLTLGTESSSSIVNMAGMMMGGTMIDACSSDVRVARRVLGGPLFLLCSQALTESLARTALLPLPIRILIPVSYNALRLSSLQSWAFFQGDGGGPPIISASLRALGVANLVYWYANLLFFLVPVGVVRYLRAHFFCVEAMEVTVRRGGESSIGLLP